MTQRMLFPDTVRTPSPLCAPRDTEAGRRTSVAKLNGRVYTPAVVAERMLSLVRWPAPGSGRLLDPACGDGVFLEAAIRKLCECGLGAAESREAIRDRLEGWDIDRDALDACSRRIASVVDELGIPGVLPRLVHRDALAPADARYACVVANPPYLEAKRMPDGLKARVRAACPLAGRGAFDLYTAFVERALSILEEGGEFCFIIPNRFLVVDYARPLREELLRRFEIAVSDLSRERVFEGAAVYPVILHARRSARPSYSVAPPSATTDAPRPATPPAAWLAAEVLRKHPGAILPVAPEHPGGRALMARLLDSREFVPLHELVETRWCVSFHRAGLRDRFTFPEKPERPGGTALRFLGGGRFAGNREVLPFRIRWGGWWIDYDEERARRLGNPLPPVDLFRGPKIVLCQNARRARAAIDREDLVLKDTFLALRPRPGAPEGLLEWLTIVLHSDLFHYVYEHLYGGTRKAGGYLHFLPGHLDPFPVPPVPEAAAMERAQALVALGESAPRDVEALVHDAYGVRAAERLAVEGYR